MSLHSCARGNVVDYERNRLVVDDHCVVRAFDELPREYIDLVFPGT